MLWNNCSIQITLHYYYIVFNYSLFLRLHLKRYKLLLFLWFFIHKVLFSGFLVINFSFSLLLTCLFILIGSVFIDPETCPQVWLKFFCGPYPKRIYVFASPTGLWKVAARLPVFVILPVVINIFIVFKESIPSSSSLQLCR